MRGASQGDIDALAAELIAWGVPEDEAVRSAAEQLETGADVAPECFEVWPENETALTVFLACETQWRFGVMGGVLGLDYAAVESVLRLMKIEAMPQLFGDLQSMERAALEELNRRG
ncbi:MAG: DUF1799 domain-containing protein [Pseudomonadota bacterium]